MIRITKSISLILLFILVSGALASQLVTVREAGERQLGYTTNSGELVSDVLVGQTFKANSDNLSGISVMFATYSGRENTGPIKFYLRRSIEDSVDLSVGAVQPQTLGDNQFYRFEFEPLADSAGQKYFFFVVSPASSPGNAVTVDLDGRDPYPLGSAYVVRGQGAVVTNPQILARSGKPSLDVAFEAYYSVPLGVAAVNKVVATGRHFAQTWDEHRASYIIIGRIAAIALLLLVLLIAFVTLLQLPVKWILGALLILAVVVRLLYAAELPATNDEGNYLYDARTLLEGKLAGGDGYVKAPLVIVWVALWNMLGQSILIGRLSSIVVGALTLLPLYILGREFGGRRAGLIAAALWALLGVTTVFNIYVHTQPLAIFFGVSGLAVLIIALRGTVPLLSATVMRHAPAGVNWFLLAGLLLGLGVVSRKSVLALGLVPLVLILVEGKSWRSRFWHLAVVGAGFLLVVVVLLTYAGMVYGVEGFWEALGVNSAADGISGVDPSEIEKVYAYSIRGMTPFFRESLPLILLATIGLGVAIERLLRVVIPAHLFAFRASSGVTGLGGGASLVPPAAGHHARSAPQPAQRVLASLPSYIISKLGWIVPLAAFWWAWGFFLEHEGSSMMVFGMRALWYAMAAVLIGAAILPDFRASGQMRRQLSAVLVVPLWIGGLVFFYMNWIKFHANYIGEFLPPLVLLAGLAVPGIWERLRELKWAAVRVVLGLATLVIVMWAVFTSGYVTFMYEHTGTFQLGALDEAGRWAAENIPMDEPIFTGAAHVPYLSGHHTALDIAHPRWYAYEFTRKDTKRLDTFLPPAEEMVQAFKQANWFLLDRQTAFSFLMEYSEIEAGLERDFESVKGISNGSNTLTFYRRIR